MSNSPKTHSQYSPSKQMNVKEQYPINEATVAGENLYAQTYYPNGTPMASSTYDSQNAAAVVPHQQHEQHPQQSQHSQNYPQFKGRKYVDIGSRKPVLLTYCPNCANNQVITHTRTKATRTTWVCVLAGVFIFWPLCWIPLAVRPMQQTNHYCHNCGVKVGRVKPFQ